MPKTPSVTTHRIPRLLLITHAETRETKKNLAVFEAALAGGVDAIMLREPQDHTAQLLATAAHLRELTHSYQAQLLIHTHADIAQAVGADGVHVRACDMLEIEAMKTWGQQDMLFSASCHHLTELQQAHSNGADFALLSPVFTTQSHPETTGLGVAKFKAIAQQSPLPVLALGGITPDNRHQLASYGVATMRALLLANCPKQMAQQLSNHWKKRER